VTYIVEHTSIRYTWELVRHTYLVDIGYEIGIQLVERSPLYENQMIGPPHPPASCFEIEIDQIQKGGKAVFSFRNICPVQINRKRDWNFLNCRIRIGSPQVMKRFRSGDGEAETRWLYTDDFFLMSISSGDRDDLSMLISQILGKLNMIALSIQSGKRILSELENQKSYQTAMTTMFADGVEGAFRDVPVYRQHGEVTGSVQAGSAAAESAPVENIPVTGIPVEGAAAERAGTGSAPRWSICEESIPVEGAQAGSATAESAPVENIPVTGIPVEGAAAERAGTGSASGWNILEERIPVESTGTDACPETILAETAPAETVTPECAPALPIPDGVDSEKKPSGPRPEARLAIDIKPVGELQDLSWLDD
jgi:hypothetical protein